MQRRSSESERLREVERAGPITRLRDWLDHLAARDRLAVVRPGVALRFELAAIAKRLDGLKATFFPRPGGHAVPGGFRPYFRPSLDGGGDGR